MLTFRTPKTDGRLTSLPAYFQETVFLAATDAQASRSFFRKVWGTDYKKAEETARAFMNHGRKLAMRMGDPNFSTEDGIVALLDRKREQMGVAVNKTVHYKPGDANRLWPGLHFSGF